MWSGGKKKKTFNTISALFKSLFTPLSLGGGWAGEQEPSGIQPETPIGAIYDIHRGTLGIEFKMKKKD